eukprot:297834_1
MATGIDAPNQAVWDQASVEVKEAEGKLQEERDALEEATGAYKAISGPWDKWKALGKTLQSQMKKGGRERKYPQPPRPDKSAMKKAQSALDKAKVRLNLQAKQAAFDAANALANEGKCPTIKAAFQAGSPGNWEWQKNRPGIGHEKTGTIMYFKQDIMYAGHTYTAYAHIHGNYDAADRWQYQGHNDRLKVAGSGCPKWEDFDHTLHDQIAPAAFIGHNTRNEQKENYLLPPLAAKYVDAMDNIYSAQGVYGSDTYFGGYSGYDMYDSGMIGYSNDSALLVLAAIVLTCVVSLFIAFLCWLLGAFVGFAMNGKWEKSKSVPQSLDYDLENK